MNSEADPARPKFKCRRIVWQAKKIVLNGVGGVAPLFPESASDLIPWCLENFLQNTGLASPIWNPESVPVSDRSFRLILFTMDAVRLSRLSFNSDYQQFSCRHWSRIKRLVAIFLQPLV